MKLVVDRPPVERTFTLKLTEGEARQLKSFMGQTASGLYTGYQAAEDLYSALASAIKK
jgi:hypothetical protein